MVEFLRIQYKLGRLSIEQLEWLVSTEKITQENYEYIIEVN